MSSKNHLQRLQSGEGSQFNSSIACLERMHDIMTALNKLSADNSTESVVIQKSFLYRLEMELYPYLNKEEKEKVAAFRVADFPAHIVNNIVIRKMNDYERLLRTLHAVKGFGMISTDVDDSPAIYR